MGQFCQKRGARGGHGDWSDGPMLRVTRSVGDKAGPGTASSLGEIKELTTECVLLDGVRVRRGNGDCWDN